MAPRPRAARLLNYCGIGPDVIDYVVDRSTVKQGRYTPGTHLAIHSPDKLAEARPGLCTAAELESGRRDSGPATRVPAGRRAIHHSDSARPRGLGSKERP